MFTVVLVVQDLLPFKFVESSAFKKLGTTLKPCLQATSRPTLKKRMKGRLLILKQNFLAALKTVDFVATTTNCWTAIEESPT